MWWCTGGWGRSPSWATSWDLARPYFKNKGLRVAQCEGSHGFANTHTAHTHTPMGVREGKKRSLPSSDFLEEFQKNQYSSSLNIWWNSAMKSHHFKMGTHFTSSVFSIHSWCPQIFCLFMMQSWEVVFLGVHPLPLLYNVLAFTSNSPLPDPVSHLVVISFISALQEQVFFSYFLSL